MDGSVDFSAGETQGLAGFGDDELGEAVLLIEESSGDVFEDLTAFPAWEGAGAAQAGDCMIDGLASIGACGYGYAADEPAVPRERTSNASPSIHSLPQRRKPVCEPGRIFMGRTPEGPADDGTRMGVLDKKRVNYLFSRGARLAVVTQACKKTCVSSLY